MRRKTVVERRIEQLMFTCIGVDACFFGRDLTGCHLGRQLWLACGGFEQQQAQIGHEVPEANQLSTSAITVTAKMAKVYSPVMDLAMPMGKEARLP